MKVKTNQKANCKIQNKISKWDEKLEFTYLTYHIHVLATVPTNLQVFSVVGFDFSV